MSDKDANELLQIIKNGPSIQRPRALKELRENYGRDYVELYKECLSDKDWHVREQAIFALGKWLGKNIIEEIRQFENDKSFGVREAVKKVISENQ